jgi:hypothetical protein
MRQIRSNRRAWCAKSWLLLTASDRATLHDVALGVALSLHWPSWLVVLVAIAAFNTGVAALLSWLWFRDYHI